MTDTEPATEAPARKGPKMCEVCGERRAVGGKSLGKAAAKCIKCIRDVLRSGKCPICDEDVMSTAHEECMKEPEPATA